MEEDLPEGDGLTELLQSNASLRERGELAAQRVIEGTRRLTASLVAAREAVEQGTSSDAEKLDAFVQQYEQWLERQIAGARTLARSSADMVDTWLQPGGARDLAANAEAQAWQAESLLWTLRSIEAGVRLHHAILQGRKGA